MGVGELRCLMKESTKLVRYLKGALIRENLQVPELEDRKNKPKSIFG